MMHGEVAQPCTLSLPQDEAGAALALKEWCEERRHAVHGRDQAVVYNAQGAPVGVLCATSLLPLRAQSVPFGVVVLPGSATQTAVMLGVVTEHGPLQTYYVMRANDCQLMDLAAHMRAPVPLLGMNALRSLHYRLFASAERLLPRAAQQVLAPHVGSAMELCGLLPPTLAHAVKHQLSCAEGVPQFVAFAARALPATPPTPPASAPILSGLPAAPLLPALPPLHLNLSPAPAGLPSLSPFGADASADADLHAFLDSILPPDGTLAMADPRPPSPAPPRSTELRQLGQAFTAWALYLRRYACTMPCGAVPPGTCPLCGQRPAMAGAQCADGHQFCRDCLVQAMQSYIQALQDAAHKPPPELAAVTFRFVPQLLCPNATCHHQIVPELVYRWIRQADGGMEMYNLTKCMAPAQAQFRRAFKVPEW